MARLEWLAIGGVRIYKGGSERNLGWNTLYYLFILFRLQRGDYW